MKLAVLFRGPMRPNIQQVLENAQLTIDELTAAGHDVTSFLATWSTHETASIQDLVSQKHFDHCIISDEPDIKLVNSYVHRQTALNGHGTVYNIWKMYTQSKYAIDQIVQTESYDRIIHSRTDIRVNFGNHLDTWLESSSTYYVRPRCDAAWWYNDTVGVTTPIIMQRVWNWNSYEELGQRIDKVTIPEEVLMDLIKDSGYESIGLDLQEAALDPTRNS